MTGKKRIATRVFYPLELWLVEQQEEKLNWDLEGNEEGLANKVQQIKVKQDELEAARQSNDETELNRIAMELEALALEGNTLYRCQAELSVNAVVLN